MSDTPDFHLNDDGTVTMVAGKVTHRLNRPTIGQLRKLTGTQRALAEASAMVLVRVAKITHDAPEQAEGEDDQAYLERRAADRIAEASERQKIDDEYEAQVVAWARDAMVMLSDRRDDVPDLDDMPGYVIDRTLPVRLLNHWRSVPLAHGGPSGLV